MLLENFKEYRIGKKLLSEINGSGYGSVTCNNGESFDAPAASEDSVETGGSRWCRDRGGVSSSMYVGDLQ